MKNRIIIHSPKVKNKNILICKFTATIGIRKFFCNDYFFAEYERDIDKVHESILVIPILTIILPVAWIYNSDVIIDSLDENFYNCFEDIKRVLIKMYPDLTWSGSVVFKNLVNNKMQNNSKSAVLFSCGIDSLFSFINHKNENSYLITIWGADIHLFNKELFKKLIYEIRNFAEFNKIKSLVVKTNFVDFLNQHLLYSYFYEKLPYSWYNGIQHGIGLLGLCAPLTKTENLKTIYIPSTYSGGFRLPCGSDPELDSSVKWSNINIVHDGYEFSRQHKTNVISDYFKTENYKIKIHACYSDLRELNCSKCEKCLRTIIGLLTAGLNPNDYGFKISKDTLPIIKNKLINGNMLADERIPFFWNDIKRNINMEKIYKIDGSIEFFEWLKSVSLEKYINKNTNKNKITKRLLRKIIKYFYPIFNFIYKILPKEPLYKLYFRYLNKQNSL